ncbi:putative bifunctional diguanylate cyclase/phosphodiesterase [Magnetofaba australis]|uniref:Putative response regulator receiver modulated diguanylate cyclase/phosphodiesterase with PAS/PAC sensor n=1 Tax=Magnetofaba australis IT-1 TaxID=1434232 RepID=A0A1Y2JZ40_9PROT|nr:EAL domain-containing protein [Magnetofaba australis]OSM00170.1 putative response regulator receiver modulated diguanylate cyclase/phosphodiesterase with PAS/PAC sensor [Magnetofaba australis IT-1]
MSGMMLRRILMVAGILALTLLAALPHISPVPANPLQTPWPLLTVFGLALLTLAALGRQASLNDALHATRNELALRIAAHEAELEELRLVRHAFQFTSEGVVITDVNGHIVDVNPAFTAITGYAKSEVLGKGPNAFHFASPDPTFSAQVWGELRARGRWSGEVTCRRQNGDLYPELMVINAVRNAAGVVTHHIALITDLSEVRSTESQLQKLVYFDDLTGLPNRTLFQDRLNHDIALARRHKYKLAVLFLDLDRFKRINDTLGHEVGDRLLKQVAERLALCVRSADTVARNDELGDESAGREATVARMCGDEFTLVLTDVKQSEGAAIVAQRINEALSRPFEVDGHELVVTASIGVSLFPEDGDSCPTLAQCADLAMSRAKSAGRNTYRFHSMEQDRRGAERLALESDLRRAVENGELEVYYQPKVRPTDHRIVGMEALMRWPSPKRGMVYPTQFIPLAEECGLIVPMGRWVLQRACADAQQLSQLLGEPLRVAVNLSSNQMRHDDISARVAEALAAAQLPAEQLELEVTESLMIHNMKAAVALLNDLRARRVRIAMDDFGVGYSSLSQLAHLSLDVLKIDRAFVRNMEQDAGNAAIIEAIINLAANLKLEVVAEGAETLDQVTRLKDLGCDLIQGYYYSKPLSLADLIAALQQGATFPREVDGEI